MLKSIFNKDLLLSSEGIFVLYFWGFVLIRPLVLLFTPFSTIILLLYVLGLFGYSALKLTKGIRINRNQFFVILFTIFVFVFDLLFRYNTQILTYFFDFLIYGIIPMYFLSQVENIKSLLLLFSDFSVLLFVIYGWDPLLGYLFFPDQMTYGYNLALPAFIGIHFKYHYFKGKKIFLALEIIAFIIIGIFASRGVTVSLVLFLFLYKLFSIKKLFKKIIFVVISFVVVYIAYSLIDDLVLWLHPFLIDKGFDSNALHKMYNVFVTDGRIDVSSGRYDIWVAAKEFSKNNILFGSGTSSFYSSYNEFPHNIYYHILVQYGIFGLVVISSFILFSLRVMIKYSNEIRYLGIMLFCLWFPRLMLSSYFFKDLGFWCFISFGLLFYRKTKVFKNNSYE